MSETTSAASVDADAQPVVDDAQLAVDAIVADHGEEGAFRAAIWALERGYSSDQVIAGALEGRLQADGVIVAAAGATESPDGSPLGLVALPGPDFESMGITGIRVGFRHDTHAVTLFDVVTVEELIDRLEESQAEALVLLFGGLASGYSPMQVVVALIDGSRRWWVEDRTAALCFIIYDATGRAVVPEDKAKAGSTCWEAIKDKADEADRVTDQTISAEPDDAEQVTDETISAELEPFPWTFEGTGTRTLTASTNFGIKGSDTVSSRIEIVIVLEEGGEATGTFTFHRELVFDCTQEKGRHGNVYARDREQEVVWEGTHTWNSDLNAGSFALLPGTTQELAGSYDAAAISGSRTQEYTIPARNECDGTSEDRRELEFKDVPRQR